VNFVLNNRPLDRNGCCVRLRHLFKDLGTGCSGEYPHFRMACTKPFTHLTELRYFDFKRKKKLLYHIRSYSVTTYSNTVTCLNSQFKRNDKSETRLREWTLCP